LPALMAATSPRMRDAAIGQVDSGLGLTRRFVLGFLTATRLRKW
jgi:hypothetical protein